MKNIHKLNLLAASVAIAVSGGANASALSAQDPAVTEIIVGGATAPQNFMREDLMIRVCNAGELSPVQVFVESIKLMPSEVAGGNILEAGNQAVVHCTAGNNMPAGLAGKSIAVYKLNGGSATGVAPVAEPNAADPSTMTYLDASVAGCTAKLNSVGANQWPIGTTGGTFELYECTDAALLKTQKPDAGISDVEPSLFVGPLALDAGVEPFGVAQKPTQNFDVKTAANLNINPGPGLIFGTAVTLPMYNELGGAQYAAGMMQDCETVLGEAGVPTRAAYDGAAQSVRDRVECMPSLPSAAVTSVFTGQVGSWADLKPYGLALNTAGVSEGNNVHMCKRRNGSGTHAQFSVNFMHTNCLVTSNTAMSEQNDGVSYAPAGFVGVYANRGSSDMDDCLRALGDGTGFNGDFTALPQVIGDPKGDSSVVPGSALTSTAVVQITGGTHPLGLTYNNGGLPFTAFAMGYNALEKNTSLSLAYRFVKIDEVPPTLEEAVAGNYRDIYYLSYQYRGTVADKATPDLLDGGIRTNSASKVAVAKAYFSIWTDTAPAAIAAVNEGFLVDPDGIANNGDEWQGGFLSPIKGAAFAYDSVTPTPATAWARQTSANNPEADSCQDLSLKR